MPPVGEDRPEENTYVAIETLLTEQLDSLAEATPQPGRTPTIRRLNRSEYGNAIRNLLALEVDVSELIPADEESHGFDNITVAGLPPILLDRYISAAQKISRLAVGARIDKGAEKTYRIRPDITQDAHLPGTPLGTRGGSVFTHNFPQDGEYEIQVWLMRDRNEELEGRPGTYDLELTLDREQLKLLTFDRPRRGANDKSVDADLKVRAKVAAGPHDLGAHFLQKSSSLEESIRQPLDVHYNFYRHPRVGTALYQVTIRGPFQGSAPKDTPSRRRIFDCTLQDESDDTTRAKCILTKLMRLAYRREIDDQDLESPMEFFQAGRQLGGFGIGIEKALGSILVSPHFLLRIEREPRGISADSAYSVSPGELASRLSFFIWSSIPDDELLELARTGQLQDQQVLESQVRRMLSDKRSTSLITNFGAQWLHLRNLDTFVPDMRLYPNFGENLRQAFRKETELFLEGIVREDRSVLELIEADYTYLNQRLAKHYGIDHVFGSHFRRVELGESSHRGGLLRHGSILCVTSYATRTSPVIRGNWVLDNLLGSPAPPPPPDIPALDENEILSATLSVRERLNRHRADPSCAKCHDLIDPVGFALENFDAVGRWRVSENGKPIFNKGTLPDGNEFVGVEGLEHALLDRPELFVRALTEKLLTFALGRGLDYHDAPAVRQIVRDASKHDYRFSELVLGIARSVPFQMRSSE